MKLSALRKLFESERQPPPEPVCKLDETFSLVADGVVLHSSPKSYTERLNGEVIGATVLFRWLPPSGQLEALEALQEGHLYLTLPDDDRFLLQEEHVTRRINKDMGIEEWVVSYKVWT